MYILSQIYDIDFRSKIFKIFLSEYMFLKMTASRIRGLDSHLVLHNTWMYKDWHFICILMWGALLRFFDHWILFHSLSVIYALRKILISFLKNKHGVLCIWGVQHVTWCVYTWNGIMSFLHLSYIPYWFLLTWRFCRNQQRSLCSKVRLSSTVVGLFGS
jgi:hypothetical protein